MPILKIQAGRVVNTTVDTYVAQHGTIFYDEDTGQLRLGDGVTPGGSPITNTGTTITSLSNLTDVDISASPINGQALIFNSTTNKWNPQSIVTVIPAASASILGGVKISTDFIMDATNTLFVNINALRQYFYTKTDINEILTSLGLFNAIDNGYITDGTTVFVDYNFITSPVTATQDNGFIFA